MADETRKPLSVRAGRRTVEHYEGPFDGLPSWLLGPVTQWAERVLERAAKNVGYSPVRDELLLIQGALRDARFPEPPRWHDPRFAIDFVSAIQKDGGAELLLDFVDALLGHQLPTREEQTRLLAFLTTGGSAWTVVQEGRLARLEQRVAPELRDVAQRVGAKQENAGKLLGLAWSHVYGRSPDPSGGYREAVRAVEAASKPVFAPREDLYTLGKLRGSLRTEPWKWKIRYEVNEKGPDTVASLTHMVDLLWTGQVDRHGTDDTEAPLHVSQQTAEAALPLAVTLAHWFLSGVVEYRPEEPKPGT